MGRLLRVWLIRYGGDALPNFSWKWWWEKVFTFLDRVEKRDIFIAGFALGGFALIWTEKISDAHAVTVITGLLSYALGRPNSTGQVQQTQTSKEVERSGYIRERRER